MFIRPLYHAFEKRLLEVRHFIQDLAGPRQIGKTQLARWAMEPIKLPSHYATADSPTMHDAIRHPLAGQDC